jgi:UDP-glucuronate 4-epimerase
VELLAAALGVDPRIEYLPEQPGDPPHTLADIGAAQAALGYAPRVGLAEGLGKFAQWLRDQPSCSQ